MKICILSYEYHPFPGGGIATYNNAAARALADAGHEVHVVTNAAWHGSRDPSCTHRRWQDGNLHIHRIHYFNEARETPDNAQFFDLDPNRYSDRSGVWAREPSNQAAHKATSYIEALHKEVGLDVIESPEFFAEAFYILRRRNSGEAHRFPPVLVHGHVSSRIAFGTNQHVWELGWYPHRQMLLREEYCVQNADALLTPSRALMGRYEALFGDRLPADRMVAPYFLELPKDAGALPKGLDAKTPFLVLLGRIEPRKGSDLAMRAFNTLAEKHPTLKLAFCGKPMWHHGESIDEVIAANVDARHRNRIVRLGNVPRDQALAAAGGAAAFLHPAPWDNYPCAVLEAMGMGAACVVSDQGGQSEMVVDGQSGLVVPAGDAGALATAVDRMLVDSAFATRMREGAKARVASITDRSALLDVRMQQFERMVERERRARSSGRQLFELPVGLRHGAVPAALPGKGLVVIDVAGAEANAIASTRKSVEFELAGSPDWNVALFVAAGQEVDAPGDWLRFCSVNEMPWLDRDDDDVCVWMRAGVRLDEGRLANVVAQPLDSRVPCASFAWLRPKDARAFPYPSDAGWQDVLVGGRALAQVFAARARHFRAARFLSGLSRFEHRLAAIPAAIAASADLMIQHIGMICGDFYADLPIVDEDTQNRAFGYLDVLGLAPRKSTVIGNLPIPIAPTADVENMVRQAREEGRKEGHAAGLAQGRTEGAAKNAKSNGSAVPAPTTPERVAPPPPIAPGPPSSDHGVRIDPQRLTELEKVFREHQALKRSLPAKLLRKLGMFGVLRRVYPKSRGALGPGD
ncbi:MAG: glycosyltransferase [Planctomycetota bacterium]